MIEFTVVPAAIAGLLAAACFTVAGLCFAQLVRHGLTALLQPKETPPEERRP